MPLSALHVFKNARSKTSLLPTLTGAYDKDSNGGAGDNVLAVSELADSNSAGGVVRVDHTTNDHSYYYTYTGRSASSGAGNLTGVAFLGSTNADTNADIDSGAKVFMQELVAEWLNLAKTLLDSVPLDRGGTGEDFSGIPHNNFLVGGVGGGSLVVKTAAEVNTILGSEGQVGAVTLMDIFTLMGA